MSIVGNKYLSVVETESNEELDDGTGHSPIAQSISPQQPVQIPAHFWDDCDGNDGLICEIGQCVDPECLASEVVFWVDCNIHGSWVHKFCAFKKNTVTAKFICKSCLN